MIRRLRRRHAILIPCLALALPLGATLALSGRPQPASGGDWPEELRGPSLQGAESLGRSRSMLGETGVGVDFELLGVDGDRLLRASGGSGEGAPPDLLLYWAPGALRDEDALPAEARYLGTLRGSRPTVFDLPGEVGREPGYLIGHSLARGQRAFTAEVPPIDGEDDR